MIWAAEATTLGVLLCSRWFYERQPFYLSWGAGFILHGTGVGLVALRSSLPEFLSIEIANTVALSGVGLWIAGMMQFDNRRVDPYVAIPALIWIAGMFLNPVRETFAYRVALFHGAASIGYLMLIGVTLSGQYRKSQTRRVFAGFIGIQAVSGLLVAGLVLTEQPASFATNTKSLWLLMSAALCFVAAVMCGAKFINERSEAKLKLLALTDPLTNVLNRRGLIEEFHRLKKNAPPDVPMLALIHFDLDGFKQINDRYGHQAGDEVLVAFARIGAASQRGRGSFGRMGGEEFASIVHVRDMIEAASIAEAIRLTLKHQLIKAGEHQIICTVSNGIALAETRDANLDALLSAADRALYVAKTSGRDRTAISTDGDVSIIPAVDHTEETPAIVDISRQIAALKRIAAIAK
jgi:diguanylate cyclase (GGDEF)-like protein